MSEIARKTGDKEVMSSTDLGILALAYELECELRGGEAWMRKEDIIGKKEVLRGGLPEDPPAQVDIEKGVENPAAAKQDSGEEEPSDGKILENGLPGLELSEAMPASVAVVEQQADEEDTGDSDDSLGGEWITPSNIHKFRNEAECAIDFAANEDSPIYTACVTSDFAMQNILLLLPITLLSPTSPYMRIKSAKTWLLRCHACFYITRNMKLQFCPRCGGPTLLRTSCSTDSETGKTTIYLKKNFQWNNRGNVYAVPRPTGGRANGKEGNGVKHELILRADQKEYVRQQEEIDRRTRKGERDLMDVDYLPGILTGDRTWYGGRVKVGHGKQNPNAKKRAGGRKK